MTVKSKLILIHLNSYYDRKITKTKQFSSMNIIKRKIQNAIRKTREESTKTT